MTNWVDRINHVFDPVYSIGSRLPDLILRIFAPLDNLARAGAPEWLMNVLSIVMFGGWSITYLLIILKSRRDKSYGIPFTNTCLNFSWELTFAFDLMGGLPAFWFPLRLGHLFWLVPNSANAYYTWKYAPGLQRSKWLHKNFKGIFIGTFIICFTLMSTYHVYSNDIFGVASSWIINLMMSWMFIKMFLDRREKVNPDGTVNGMSLPAACWKFIGNAAGAVFCFYWWPQQFALSVAPDHTLRHIATTVHEPRTYAFLYVVYVVNLALDLLLIGMLRERLAEIRQSKLKPSKDYHFRLA